MDGLKGNIIYKWLRRKYTCKEEKNTVCTATGPLLGNLWSERNTGVSKVINSNSDRLERLRANKGPRGADPKKMTDDGRGRQGPELRIW